MTRADDVGAALAALDLFGIGAQLTERIATLEYTLRGLGRNALDRPLGMAHANPTVLSGAVLVKDVSRQIDVVIHALGILLALPLILEEGEVIESLSLGAGSTGKPYDLETNLRIAEFKFIAWRGGPESIRQNSLFADVFRLAEANTSKRRQMYVTDVHHPSKFLNGGRALTSVLSKNAKVAADFALVHGDRFLKVRDYWLTVRDRVELVDVTPLVPVLAGMPPEPEPV